MTKPPYCQSSSFSLCDNLSLSGRPEQHPVSRHHLITSRWLFCFCLLCHLSTDHPIPWLAACTLSRVTLFPIWRCIEEPSPQLWWIWVSLFPSTLDQWDLLKVLLGCGMEHFYCCSEVISESCHWIWATWLAIFVVRCPLGQCPDRP